MQKTPFQTPMALHCICFLLVLIDTYSLYSMISHLLWLLKLQHKPFLINSLFLTKHDRHLIKQNTQKDCVDLSIIAFKLQEISNTLQETKHITIVMTVQQGTILVMSLDRIYNKFESSMSVIVFMYIFVEWNWQIRSNWRAAYSKQW